MPNRELLLIPGPTPVHDEIYEALAQETWSHTDPRFAAVLGDCLALARQLWNTDGEVYAFAGSGTLAMELALVNTVAPGETLLVVSQGYFGDRFAEIGQAYGLQVEVVRSAWGEQVDPEKVRQALARGGVRAVTLTHVDTSTGVCADLAALVPVIKESGALCILDGVCATAAMDEDMSRPYGRPEWTLDVVLTASQKALGVPPGLGLVAFGPRALAARAALPRVPAYFLDIARWRPIMEDPTRYFATPPVNMVYALHKGLQIVMAEGLAARYARHERLGQAVRAALRQYGFQPLAEEAAAAPTLTCALCPEGVDESVVRKQLAARGVVVAGGLAHLAGRAVRMGHMGNVRAEQVAQALQLVGEVLQANGRPVPVAAAVAAFWQAYGQA
ncbi:MAG: alanine--glyoxylate aminotransferase family protein [Alicyclobacillus sp.]|nr:alanine--glyoxylate aminotransferase family protein [Alicyclobacillus sp.]